MALTSPRDALRPVAGISSRGDSFLEGESFNLHDFEEEMKRLSVANDELLADIGNDGEEEEDLECTRVVRQPVLSDEFVQLQRENAELKARIHELEAAAAGDSESGWLERQQEYEMLLEEKSEVIRALHQKVQELQESGGPRPSTTSGPAVGQAEEILRLKRELEDQRRQLEQDEEDMMAQLRQMELTMAKERAEMARQRQEMSRVQSDLAHEIEQNNRDSGLKERLQGLRRSGSQPTLQAPPASGKPESAAASTEAKKSSGFFRRLFS